MRDVWIVTLVVWLYGLANGVLLNATPQLSLKLDLGSRALGIIGAGLPIGYASSCLICGRVFHGFRGKYVLIGGTITATLSMILMSQAQNAWMCVAAQLGYGLSSGAFWPFASAWLLDFHTEAIPKTRLLRHYNLAWTSGTAIGMFTGGLFCTMGYIRETIGLGAGLAGVTLVCALLAKATQPHAEETSSSAQAAPAPGVALSFLLAAVIANLIALGTRTMFVNNYAELNAAMNFDASRLGLLSALCLVSQVVFFGLGAIYEPWLGLRRIYFLLCAGLIAVNLAYAYEANIWLLAGAVVLHGLVLAISFQAGIIAAIGYFSSPRLATTFHEAVIGAGGVAPLLGGVLVSVLKRRSSDPLDALRAPYIWMSITVVVAMVLQWALVSFKQESRVLLPRSGKSAADSFAL